MTKFVGIILSSTAVILLGIVASMPLVVTAATLCACGTLLLALLRYFDAAEA